MKEQLEYLKQMFDEDFVKELVREERGERGLFKQLYKLFSKDEPEGAGHHAKHHNQPPSMAHTQTSFAKDGNVSPS